MAFFVNPQDLLTSYIVRFIVLFITRLYPLKGNDMNTMTANELKTKGVSAVEAHLKDEEEVIITVRGQDRYVVIDVEKYAKLREYELTVALQEAKADVEAGRYVTESVADHMARMSDV